MKKHTHCLSKEWVKKRSGAPLRDVRAESVMKMQCAEQRNVKTNKKKRTKLKLFKKSFVFMETDLHLRFRECSVWGLAKLQIQYLGYLVFTCVWMCWIMVPLLQSLVVSSAVSRCIHHTHSFPKTATDAHGVPLSAIQNSSDGGAGHGQAWAHYPHPPPVTPFL